MENVDELRKDAIITTPADWAQALCMASQDYQRENHLAVIPSRDGVILLRHATFTQVILTGRIPNDLIEGTPEALREVIGQMTLIVPRRALGAAGIAYADQADAAVAARGAGASA